MKKLIVISHPEILPNEPELLETALDAGTHYVHLRKPNADAQAIANLLSRLPAQYLPQIVLHDALHLATEYAVGGIHLNSRHPDAPAMWQGRVSRSCHTIEEIAAHKSNCHYQFLSPVYNSISKSGYRSSFTTEQLLDARNKRIIDDSVVALGGITPDNVTSALSLGFGGVALLGCLWCNPNEEHIKQTITEIKTKLLCYNS